MTRRRGRRGPSGWPHPLARQVVRTWPPSTARACGRSSCAAPTSTPATSSRSSSRAGTPSASVCPSCAERAGSCGPRSAAKAGTSTTNPSSTPTRRPRTSGHWITTGAEAQEGQGPCWPARAWTPAELDERIGELDEEITECRDPRPGRSGRGRARHRSTRRRQDAAALPRRTVSPRTVGKTYTAPDGKTFRPVAVRHADLPVLRPGRRGRSTRRPGHLRLHASAARDALHFAALFDRFIQNLRRFTRL